MARSRVLGNPGRSRGGRGSDGAGKFWFFATSSWIASKVAAVPWWVRFKWASESNDINDMSATCEFDARHWDCIV